MSGVSECQHCCVCGDLLSSTAAAAAARICFSFLLSFEDLADFSSGYALTLHQSLHFRVRGVAVVPAILCDIMAPVSHRMMHAWRVMLKMSELCTYTSSYGRRDETADRSIGQSKAFKPPAAFIEACRLLSCFGGWQLPAPAVGFAAHPRQFRYSPADSPGRPPP